MYFIENENYYFSEFCSSLNITHDVGQGVINKLLKLKVLEIDFSKFAEKDIDDLGPKQILKFIYVGVLIVKGINIKILPKYISEKDMKKPELVTNHFKDIIATLFKLQESSKSDDFINEGELVDNSNLNMIQELINDFNENGIYLFKNTDKTKYLSEINWNKTIGQNNPYIIDNIPIYLDIEYFNTRSYQNNLVSEIHVLVLKECLETLRQIGFVPKVVTEEIPNLKFLSLEEIGGIDFILNLLKRELHFVFESKKVRTLELLYQYLIREKNSSSKDIIYGVKNYWKVWEELNKYYFKDNSSHLIEKYIKKPYWVKNDGAIYNTDRSLEPDIILEDIHGDKITFIVMDAKYYKFKLINKKIYKQPGISDIIKQQFYSISFKSYLNQFEEINEMNVLIFPVFDHEDNIWGTVNFDVFNEENYYKYNEIKILMLNCVALNKAYLNDRQIKSNEVNTLLML